MPPFNHASNKAYPIRNRCIYITIKLLVLNFLDFNTVTKGMASKNATTVKSEYLIGLMSEISVSFIYKPFMMISNSITKNKVVPTK